MKKSAYIYRILILMGIITLAGCTAGPIKMLQIFSKVDPVFVPCVF